MSHKNHQRSQDLGQSVRRHTRGDVRYEEGKLLLEFLNMQAELEKMIADKKTEKK